METPLSNSGNPPPKTVHRAPLALSGLDFKLLKVFKAVVEAGGFSAAQNELNVGLAAISKQISDLEIRIGMRLCTRGREGFHPDRRRASGVPGVNRFICLGRQLS